jgi:hypothetical protein
VKWLADENFNNAIVRGLSRRSPELDLVRAQDVHRIRGRSDEALLAWATENNRALLTHDVSTMIPAMMEQMRLDGRCAAIVFVRDSLPIGAVIEDILLLESGAAESELAAGVVYLPLR